ncbi:glycine/D-amino acid oxidase, deaminating (plasmid) [Synechococcus sp. PCC 7502]|uniref:FAD-dependent oxidoreductase n=1 Tax=Synechococcus sp. PCC 7502 TaxID=1173263 RepID=UPI00029FB77E|nr:FAD-dependent oxidoreductase [Synechococcus sp. PCC 7502]AFY75474.1 glycine/D-amino acid oxidase, deaminating [Synechococcus sp. PCC 7502]
MTSLSGKHASFWIDSTPVTTYPSLENRLSVDVAIIGGGIVGLTVATLLKRAGKTVAVIESRQVALGVSGHTTAKVTALHQLIYADLIEQIGQQKAKLYAESNLAGVEQVAAFVSEEQIDCDFSRQSSYTFAERDIELDQIKDEVEAAHKLGLPATFITETSLPFAIAGAIKLENQAQFHVRKYLLHLAKNIAGAGSYLFENTRVQRVDDGDSCYVVTDLGVINAQDVVVATNLPILNLGLFFAKTYPERSYIVGAKIDPAKAPQGMYIGSGKSSHSIRTTPYEDGLLLLVGGEGHKVGTVTNTEERYQKLESYARDRFGIDTFAYRWSNQDMVSFDKLPYIGNLTPFNKHIYVATGFSLWGMSKGTMSGMILSDLILGKDNPYTDLYDSLRATPFVTVESVKQEASVVTRWIGDRFKGLLSSSFSEVAKGEGKLLTIDNEKVAAYRDEQGTIHAVSATCTHLACIVSWNNAEKSWDCACHGARFSCDGKVIQGPAVRDLEQVVN